MNTDNLFRPDIKDTQEYGRRVTELFYEFAAADSGQKIPGLTKLIPIGNIPFVLHAVGVPSGKVDLIPSNIPHMIGQGQQKTEVAYRNIHNLSLEEMLAIPHMIADPDMIFRSNTMPDSSVILCKEIDTRESPVVIAMKIDIRSGIEAAGIVVSGYEKDHSPSSFFEDLYKHGYCIYDGEKNGYFQKIKSGSGAGDRLPGPIPASAAACSDPHTNRILTKTDAVNLYRKNALELIAVLNDSAELRNLMSRNLEEIGYHTVSPRSLTTGELNSLLIRCTGVACDKNMLRIIREHIKSYPNLRITGETKDFLPEPIFSHSMKPLAEIRNELAKTTQRSHR